MHRLERDLPPDPRLAPFIRLRRLIPIVGADPEATAERKILRRADIAEAVRK